MDLNWILVYKKEVVQNSGTTSLSILYIAK